MLTSDDAAPTRPATFQNAKRKTNLILRPGIEPGTYCVLGSRHNQLDHRSLKGILGGTRTHNLEIRSLTPYPLGHEDTVMGSIRSGYPRVRRPQTARRAKTGASSGVRTHAFFRILELKSSALDHSAIEARAV